ncbi:MAG: RagB/SusD family nutrient uptake outer membrane protein [Candidatus Limisoma sp.]
MKLYKFLIPACVAMASLSLSSCSDELDATPDGRVSIDDVFADPDLCAAYFSSCFDYIPQKSVCYFWFQNYPCAITDDGWSNDDTNGPILCYKGQASAVDFPLDKYWTSTFDCEYWKHYWQQIRIINTFLQHIPTATLAREENRDIWTGEAHCLRAFFYLQLLKWYGALPIITEPLDNSYDYSQIRKASTVEVLKFICDECDEAMKSNMPWHLDNINLKYRMTKAIALAIKSEASLFAASPLYNCGEDLWQWAYDINKDVYAQLLNNGYELYTEMQTDYYNCAYGEYFATANYWGSNPIDKETIWQSDFGTQPFWWVSGTPIQGNYLSGTVPLQELVDAYDMLATGKPVVDLEKPYLDEFHLEPNYVEGSGYDPQNPYVGRDPRLAATVIFNGSTVQKGATVHEVETWVGGNCGIKDKGERFSHTGYYRRKYANYRSGNDEGKWKYYRLGCVMLNLAECAAETGKISEAMSLVNQIRHRAGFDPSVDVKATTVDQARLLVRHERRVELAYEENRYFDLRRWTPEDQDLISEKYATGMEITKTGTKLSYKRILVGTDGSVPSKYSYQAKWHFFPIPADEVARLNALTGEKWQNKGW